jgi:hypothetical protein
MAENSKGRTKRSVERRNGSVDDIAKQRLMDIMGEGGRTKRSLEADRKYTGNARPKGSVQRDRKYTGNARTSRSVEHDRRLGGNDQSKRSVEQGEDVGPGGRSQRHIGAQSDRQTMMAFELLRRVMAEADASERRDGPERRRNMELYGNEYGPRQYGWGDDLKGLADDAWGQALNIYHGFNPFGKYHFGNDEGLFYER